MRRAQPSREGVTAVADRYTGRHIRQNRHGAWRQKKRSRSRPGHANLPAAAALTISGFLIGGAGAVLQFGSTGTAGGTAGMSAYDPADLAPPDRSAQADRASRDEDRGAAPGNGAVQSNGTCQASVTDDEDLQGLRAATSNLPANSIVRVTNPANGKSVEVLITATADEAGRCLDLSRDAFQEIANANAGVVDVRYEVLLQDAT
jgi:rare lipoprotein A